MKRLIALAVLLASFLAACGGQPATATRVPATATADNDFRSGGFGETRAEWEARYNKPEKDNSGLLTYANGNYVVMFSEGRVSYLEHTWGDKDSKTRAYATGAAKPFLPRDAQLIEEYKNPRSGSTVERYRSASLAKLFPAASFMGGEPGDFIVIYRDVTGKVTSYLIAVGNNP